MRVWDLTDRTQPYQISRPLTADTELVISVVFTPDGNTLATAGADTLLWDLSDLHDLRDHPVQRACTITAGGLNPDQWNRYISGLPYQDTCPA